MTINRKPHIYRRGEHWYCRRDYESGWNQYVRQCGIAAASPKEAYRRAAEFHQWGLAVAWR